MLRYEPPRLPTCTFGGDDSVVTFELAPQGDRLLPVLSHRATGEGLPDTSRVTVEITPQDQSCKIHGIGTTRAPDTGRSRAAWDRMPDLRVVVRD